MTVPGDAFAFSPEPAWAVPWNPDTMTHRYRRYARRVGITSSLKELRHYSATQLLANGVDLIDAGMAAAADIAKPTGRDNVPVAALYLADRASVVSFVQSWHGPLHVLSMPEMLLLICMRPNGPRAA